MHRLLDELLLYEGQSACARILQALREKQHLPRLERQEFNFNVFDVTIDYLAQTALIEDILDVRPAGNVCISLDELVRALLRVQAQAGPAR